jgi:hypothetical protein
MLAWPRIDTDYTIWEPFWVVFANMYNYFRVRGTPRTCQDIPVVPRSQFLQFGGPPGKAFRTGFGVLGRSDHNTVAHNGNSIVHKTLREALVAHGRFKIQTKPPSPSRCNEHTLKLNVVVGGHYRKSTMQKGRMDLLKLIFQMPFLLSTVSWGHFGCPVALRRHIFSSPEIDRSSYGCYRGLQGSSGHPKCYCAGGGDAFSL